MYTFLKKKLKIQKWSHVGDELSQGCAFILVAASSGAVALGALSLNGRDNNVIVASFTTVLGMKNSNALYLYIPV